MCICVACEAHTRPSWSVAKITFECCGIWRALDISTIAWGSAFTDDSHSDGFSHRPFAIRFVPSGYRAIPPHPILDASTKIVMQFSLSHFGRTLIGLAWRIFAVISTNGWSLRADRGPICVSHTSMLAWHFSAINRVSSYAPKFSLLNSRIFEQYRISPISMAIWR